MAVKVSCFSVSLDGFGAGPRQDLQNPLGVGGLAIVEWLFHTRSFRQEHAGEGGETGIDNQMAERGMANLGAWVLGRNMFGPVRGPWPDASWNGWWDEEPPYHVPVFVLTHHARPPVAMQGGTVFHFVADGMQSALAQAKAAAGKKDVRIGGGVATVRQFLAAGLVDDMHLALRPVFLGTGENLWQGMDLKTLGYDCAEVVQGERATHLMVRRRA
ncbi:MAG: dihydrofolate reductase family protein [Ramlibacter sp.]